MTCTQPRLLETIFEEDEATTDILDIKDNNENLEPVSEDDFNIISTKKNEPTNVSAELIKFAEESDEKSEKEIVVVDPKVEKEELETQVLGKNQDVETPIEKKDVITDAIDLDNSPFLRPEDISNEDQLLIDTIKLKESKPEVTNETLKVTSEEIDGSVKDNEQVEEIVVEQSDSGAQIDVPNSEKETDVANNDLVTPPVESSLEIMPEPVSAIELSESEEDEDNKIKEFLTEKSIMSKNQELENTLQGKNPIKQIMTSERSEDSSDIQNDLTLEKFLESPKPLAIEIDSDSFDNEEEEEEEDDEFEKQTNDIFKNKLVNIDEGKTDEAVLTGEADRMSEEDYPIQTKAESVLEQIKEAHMTLGDALDDSPLPVEEKVEEESSKEIVPVETQDKVAEPKEQEKIPLSLTIMEETEPKKIQIKDSNEHKDVSNSNELKSEKPKKRYIKDIKKILKKIRNDLKMSIKLFTKSIPLPKKYKRETKRSMLKHLKKLFKQVKKSVMRLSKMRKMRKRLRKRLYKCKKKHSFRRCKSRNMNFLKKRLRKQVMKKMTKIWNKEIEYENENEMFMSSPETYSDYDHHHSDSESYSDIYHSYNYGMGRRNNSYPRYNYNSYNNYPNPNYYDHYSKSRYNSYYPINDRYNAYNNHGYNGIDAYNPYDHSGYNDYSHDNDHNDSLSLDNLKDQLDALYLSDNKNYENKNSNILDNVNILSNSIKPNYSMSSEIKDGFNTLSFNEQRNQLDDFFPSNNKNYSK